MKRLTRKDLSKLKDEGKLKRKALSVDNADVEDVWKPPNFENQWENLVHMRRNRDAPVDTMGCDQAGNQADTPKVSYVQLINY